MDQHEARIDELRRKNLVKVEMIPHLVKWTGEVVLGIQV